ncbi:uncharacterized protein BKA55DRAFT_543837 [Fusarium redolens]|uniref:PNPLA domain-containing protein n=1 Tax=Fusarium redolens TaxID=48865 RepID=A0A9P9GBE9_FUSRE|nr:uncharacterized protein BKA55DRAFT_543837 [Fusarium redolens]KAH7234652.1 hypothetical protein BKA55DRAFT_543837 [Fusarium redolens]
MEERGLRILSLDGGGTRGLSSIYILREILDRVAPGHGGHVRPSEYFDFIGASGPNALCALLFVRFGLTINECIEYYHELSRRLDGVEDVLNAREGEELDDVDFADFDAAADPANSLETIRQQVVGLTFKAMIMRHVTDWLERAKNAEAGQFNYKCPMATVGVGQCRAAVMGSESAGYGRHESTVAHRQYHVPIWHRTYLRRNTKTTYTCWALALGTMASPSIVRPGVVFPDFTATGAHSVHSPIELVLEECRKIWPGLRPGVIVSVGTGGLEAISDEAWGVNAPSRPLTLVAAKVCAEMVDANESITKQFERYVLPHDETLRHTYFRFNARGPFPFFEYDARENILSDTTSWMSSGEAAARSARAAALLSAPQFPDTLEDQIGLSALAGLLESLTLHGYAEEAELLSDTMTTYFLYEHANAGRRSHGKLMMAVAAERLADAVDQQQPVKQGQEPDRSSSCAARLTMHSAYGLGLEWMWQIGDLSSASDVAATAYFLLIIARRSSPQEMGTTLAQSVIRSVAKNIGMAPDLDPLFIARTEELLRLSSLACLCQSAVVEALTSEPRIIFNGPFVRYLHETIQDTNLQMLSPVVAGPLATALATIISLGRWSRFRDQTITCLLSKQLGSHDALSYLPLLNLAINREYISHEGQTHDKEDVLDACSVTLKTYGLPLAHRTPEVARACVQNGFLGVLRRLLNGERIDTQSGPITNQPTATAHKLLAASITDAGDNLLHLATRSGFIDVVKLLLEFAGKGRGALCLGQLNQAGHTPFHVACIRRVHVDVLKLCVVGGAKCDQVSGVGRSALHYCFPDKESFRPYYPDLVKLFEDFQLLVTLPLDCWKGWTKDKATVTIDPHVYDLRQLIQYIYCRGADICIQDHFGATPGHLAVRRGWHVNTDIFFAGARTEDERVVHSFLRLRDHDRASMLDLSRAMGDKAAEDMISSEMRKRCIEVPLSPPVSLQLPQPSSSNSHSPDLPMTTPPLNQPLAQPAKQMLSPATATGYKSSATYSPTPSASSRPFTPVFLQPSNAPTASTHSRPASTAATPDSAHQSPHTPQSPVVNPGPQSRPVPQHVPSPGYSPGGWSAPAPTPAFHPSPAPPPQITAQPLYGMPQPVLYSHMGPPHLPHGYPPPTASPMANQSSMQLQTMTAPPHGGGDGGAGQGRGGASAPLQPPQKKGLFRKLIRRDKS